eukprot:SAG11_NODE_743_length_7407_cov_2.941434_5_plen_79_part_00
MPWLQYYLASWRTTGALEWEILRRKALALAARTALALTGYEHAGVGADGEQGDALPSAATFGTRIAILRGPLGMISLG